GVVVANEVLDAIPVHRFKQEQTLQEFYVSCSPQGEFAYQLQEASSRLIDHVAAWELPFPEHYESEINLALPSWMQAIADVLQQGLFLIIDYGFPRHEYYHPDRAMGTLMCHYRHVAHGDPFQFIGLQDITAHVDFTAVAESATAAGLAVAGFTHQANFLLSSG